MTTMPQQVCQPGATAHRPHRTCERRVGNRRAGLAAFALLVGVATSAPAVDQTVLDAQAARIDVIARAAPAVVAIFAHDGNGGGSGVLISADGYTVTNHHVVMGLGGFMKCGLNDGRLYDAVLVGIDPTGDVALIKLLGRDDFPHAIVGDSDQVQLGDGAYAMGNPFLLATDLQPTVTYGIVSGVHRYQYPAGTFLEYTDCLQVDASINPGNSGGPLFNARGELIGINGRISVDKRGRVNAGAGYAISINQVMHFLDRLKSGRIVDHATLGATVTQGDDGAVYVASILERSEAYRRGLRSGDEVVSFAGRSIRSVNQFKNILGIYPQGWTAPLVYRREGEKHEITVRLRALHRRAELTPELAGPQRRPGGPRPEGPPTPRPEDDERPRLSRRPPPQPPAEYAHLFVEKPGFANWHFNLEHRSRVAAAFRQWGDYSQQAGNWELTGRTAEGGAVSFKLNDRAVAAVIADVPSLQMVDQNWADLPPGSGGLLAALHHLRLMLLDPEGRFTDYYYLGSEPLDGGVELVDVLIAGRGSIVSRWYFSRQEGRLIGWDTALEEDAEECRIRIEALQTFGGVQFPGRLRIEHAGKVFDTLTIDAFQRGPAS